MSTTFAWPAFCGQDASAFSPVAEVDVQEPAAAFSCTEQATLHLLYGWKPGVRSLAATFSSETQLMAYVRRATLGRRPDGSLKFEPGTVLAAFRDLEHHVGPLSDEEAEGVPHNPLPTRC